MSKEFTPVAFDPRQFKKELDQLRDLLKSKPVFPSATCSGFSRNRCISQPT